jgi:hypothetical protein
MTPISFADFLRALAIKAVLDRLGDSGPAPPPAPARTLSTAARQPRRAAADTPARPARAYPALALLAVGAPAMLIFESPVTRVIGVLALAGFVVAGVFAIADPRWLGSAPDLGHPDESRTPPMGYCGHAMSYKTPKDIARAGIQTVRPKRACRGTRRSSPGSWRAPTSRSPACWRSSCPRGCPRNGAVW